MEPSPEPSLGSRALAWIRRNHRLAMFGCGQLGIMMLARFFYQWILHFTEKGDPGFLGPASATMFTAATAGLLVLGFRIFDAVSDPIAGTLSDAWVRRGRERRALLWFSFLIPAIGLIVVFAPTPAMGATLRWGVLAGGLFLFYLGYTLYAIPYWSLVDDYSQGDPYRRGWLSNMLGIGLLVATGVGFGLSPVLIERHGFFTASLMFAVPAALLMILPYFAQPPGSTRATASGALEKPPASRPEPATQPERTPSSADGALEPEPRRSPERTTQPERTPELSPLAAFAVAFRHRRFVATIVLFSGAQMSFTVMTAAAAFIVTDLLGGTVGDVPMILGPFLGTALLSLAAVPHFARKYGWERVMAVACLALAVVYAGTGALGITLIGSPLVTAAIVFACGGPMAAVALGLEGEAVAACAQETGEEVTSVYFGVFNLVVKGLNAVALQTTAILSTLASGAWGTAAVRAMGVSAGLMLVLGLVGYGLLRRRADV